MVNGLNKALRESVDSKAEVELVYNDVWVRRTSAEKSAIDAFLGARTSQLWIDYICIQLIYVLIVCIYM